MNRTVAPVLLIGLTACAGTEHRPENPFLAGLAPLCGKSYTGAITENSPEQSSDPFVGKALIIHVRDCEPDVVRIPLHVGDDRSRTWVLSEQPGGLQLKHDHRHNDGTADTLTMYGGTANVFSATRAEFPADAESIALFKSEGRLPSIDNTWSLTHIPGEALTYRLQRPNRVFEIRFDLSRTVPEPPPAWGQ